VAKAKLVSAWGQGAGQRGLGAAKQAESTEREERESVPGVVGPNLTLLPTFCSAPHRKKTLLALFVALATIGLIAGLIVAFKPDKNKAVTGPSKVSKLG